MGQDTKIEWAHHTFNPWIGCTKVSPACDHCYAEADFATRRKVVQWGAGQPRKRTAPSTWAQPLRWNAEAERLGVRYRVFCASLADVFDNEVPPAWREDLFTLIEQTPHLDWLLLTKRIGNAREMMFLARGGHLPLLLNVWIGASVTSQAEADRDIPKLLAAPAAKRFLSMEPLLGPVNLRNIPIGEGEADCLKPDLWETEIENWRGTSDTWEEDFEDWYNTTIPGDGLTGPMHAGVDWVIVGGESGPNARPMHPDWARSLRDQCQAAGVPFLFKQWGEWWEVDSDARDENGNHIEVEPDSSEGRELWDPKTDVLLHVDGRRFTPETLPDDTPARLMTRLGKKAAGRLLDGREWNEVPA